jgi:hypothetical protein
MRSVRKGHRIIRSHWLEKTNKESGVPDIGIRAWTNSRGSRQVHLKTVNALGTCISLMVNIFIQRRLRSRMTKWTDDCLFLASCLSSQACTPGFISLRQGSRRKPR